MLVLFQGVDTTSSAYQAGHTAGKIFMAVVGLLVVYKVIQWLRNR